MISKRTILVVAVIILTAITAAICFTAINGGSAGAQKSGLTVVLDAGHGGIDGGVTGVNTGVKESELNLLIVKKLRDYLFGCGALRAGYFRVKAQGYGKAARYNSKS